MIVAIHQPNFFPWLGFFNKIIRCDKFILLDDVQFPKKGGNWTNRVKILVNGTSRWITIPVVRNYHGYRLIYEMEMNNSNPWREKIKSTVKLNYKKHPYSYEVMELFCDILKNPTDNLSEFNIHCIKKLCGLLAVDTNKIITSSSLEVTGKATDRLISMTKAVGGSVYLSGDGSAGYQEDEKFEQAGVELAYQKFNHPTYSQINSDIFVPGLSIIDAIMNVGVDVVKDFIHS